MLADTGHPMQQERSTRHKFASKIHGMGAHHRKSTARNHSSAAWPDICGGSNAIRVSNKHAAGAMPAA